MYSFIYDNVMKLLTQNRITPDGLGEEIAKMHVMFTAYYPNEQLDEEKLLRQILFDYGIFEGSAKVLDFLYKRTVQNTAS